MKKFTPLLRRSVLGLALLATAAAWADSGIIVVAPDGSTSEYAYSAIEQVRLDSDGVKIVTSAGAVPVAYADIERIELNAQVNTAVEVITAAGNMALWISDGGAVLNLAGAPAARDFSIVDMAGMTLAASQTDADGAARADIANLPSGAYILVIQNSHSVKFVK